MHRAYRRFLLVTWCLCLARLTKADDCLMPVPDLGALFGHSPGTEPEELARVPAADYTECMQQCCENTEELCNVLLYKPVTEDSDEPNCVVLSCEPISDCHVIQEEGVQIFADAEAVSESFAKVTTKSPSVTPGQIPPTLPPESQTDGGAGKESSPQSPTLPGRDSSLSGASTASVQDKNNSELSNDTLTPPVQPSREDTGPTAKDTEGITTAKDSSNGDSETSLPDAVSSTSGNASSTLTTKGGESVGPGAVGPQSTLTNDTQHVNGPGDENTTSHNDDVTPTQSPETNSLSNASSESSLLSTTQIPPTDHFATESHQTIPPPVSDSVPNDQGPTNTNSTSDSRDNSTTNTKQTDKSNALTKSPTSSVSSNVSSDKSSGTFSNSSSSDTTNFGSSLNSTMPLPLATTENNDLTSEATGQFTAWSTSGQEQTPASHDSVGFAAGSNIHGNETDTFSNGGDVTSFQDGASTTAVLISALAIGCFFFLVSLVLVGKRVFDGWKKRHYSRVERDYLIDGMYHE